jgi:hypothetical protein
VKESIRLVLLGLVMLPLVGQAWPWSDEEKTNEQPDPATNVTRRYHLLVPDKASEKELMQLFSAKRVLGEELRVLGMLTEEKRREMAKFDNELRKTFGVTDKGNYRFDPKTKTIYEQVPKAGGTSTTTNTTDAANPEGALETTMVFEQRVHMQLKDDAQVKLFAGMAAGKRLTVEELQVFNRVLKEKQVEMDRLDKTLKDKYSVSRDRNYWYDTKTMRLYEIVTPPRRGGKQGNTAR